MMNDMQWDRRMTVYRKKRVETGYKVFSLTSYGDLAPVISPYPKFYFREIWNERDVGQGPYTLFYEEEDAIYFYHSQRCKYKDLRIYACYYIPSGEKGVYLPSFRLPRHYSTSLFFLKGDQWMGFLPMRTVLADAFTPMRRIKT